jgi:uncharacterized protein (DUF1800 family)
MTNKQCLFVVQKDKMKPSTTQTTYHNPLSQLYFGILYELVINQQVAFVLSPISNSFSN